MNEMLKNVLRHVAAPVVVLLLVAWLKQMLRL